MGSRDMILERLKSASWAKPLPSPPKAGSESRMQEGDIQAFIDKAGAAGALAEEANSADEVQARLIQIAKEEKMKKLIISDEEVIKTLDWEQVSRETGCEVRFASQLQSNDYRSYVTEADLGVTGCQYALAETGSVVLAHSQTKERLVSHAPDYYVCILKKEQILKDRFVLAGLLGSDQPQATALTLVTGVSRTADVALQVILGMHGPRKMAIFILG